MAGQLLRLLVLAVAGVVVPAIADEIRLVDLIDEVRERGYQVVYSTDLVHAGLRVDVDERTLDALRRALPFHGLKLDAVGETWLIRSGPRRERATPTTAASQPVLESVIVTGSRHRFPRDSRASSTRRFATQDLIETPSLASDPVRAMLRVPGVSSVGVSAKPHIRGGLKDELLILQDGIELVEPFHLADYHSAYSALDYHTLESIDFYTGGFPSRYGNRMSGVMDISNRWDETPFRTDLGYSSFASFVNTRQPLPGTDDAFVGLTYRQGDLSDLTDYVEARAGSPEYRDASLRLHLPLRENTQLQAGLAYSEDTIDFDDEGERASSQIDSWYGWLQVDTRPKAGLESRLSLSAVDFSRDKRQLDTDDEDDLGSFLAYGQNIQRFTVRNDLFLRRNSVAHELGWQLEYNRADYRNRSRIDRGDLADIFGTIREVERDISQAPDGWSGGAYWAGEWSFGERWSLQPGLRVDFQDYYLERGSDYQIAPRLGVVYDASPSLTLHMNVGRFYQPEGIHELQVLDGIEQFYRPQRSDQFLAGIKWTDQRWRLVLEGYFKDYANPKGRFENVFNPFVLLPEMESDRLGLTPEKARASGFDVDLGYEVTPSASVFLRYSHMNAEDRLEGRWVDRRWSQEHTVNAGLQWSRNNFSLGVALLWHSGWRSTLLPGFVSEEDTLDPLDFLNNTELREHFSMDLSARYRWELPRAHIEIFADISNLTDRMNASGIDYDEEETEGGFLLEQDPETVLGLVPSVGFTVSF